MRGTDPPLISRLTLHKRTASRAARRSSGAHASLNAFIFDTRCKMLPSEQPATSAFESNVEPRPRKFHCGVDPGPTKAAFQRRHSQWAGSGRYFS